MATTIYVLKLKGGKYYVGRTDKNVIVRFNEHKAGKGSAWTKKYKPVELEYAKNGDKFDEDKLTKQYMEKYGIENVRGGTYCQITLSNEIVQMISKELNGGTNKCYNCGKTGHYVNKCPYEKTEEEVWCCSFCNKKFTTYKGAKYHERFYCKKKTKHCTRCNRDGHTVSQCYATTKIVDDSDEESDNYYQCSQKCYKCGKYGHYANNCHTRRRNRKYY